MKPTIPTEVAAVLADIFTDKDRAKLTELEGSGTEAFDDPEWIAAAARADCYDKIKAALVSPVCIVCDWQGDTARFVEAEVDGRSVSLPWRDRPDGLKEMVIDRIESALTKAEAVTGWAKPHEVEDARRNKDGSALAVFVYPERNETYSAPLYAHAPPAVPVELPSNDALADLRATDRIESALTKAEAVATVVESLANGHALEFHGGYSETLDALPIGTKLYAHAPPAVPVASVPDGWPAADDEQRKLGWHWDYNWLANLHDETCAAGWHSSMEAIDHVLTKLSTNQEGAAP